MFQPACLLTARLALSVAILVSSVSVRAADAPSTEVDSAIASPTSRTWGAALGFVVSVGPEYVGSRRQAVTVEPGVAVRLGRVSLASRSAFAVRGADSGASGGLRVDLARTDRFSASLSLRVDGGRRESSADRLRGMGDVRRTLLTRLSTTWRLDNRWRVGSAVLVDTLGRGTGALADFRVGRDLQLSDNTSLGYTLALSAGDRDHLRSYFGVNPEQSQRSGYAVFEPNGGVVDVKLSLSARTELTPHWAVFYGGSVSRLVGSAARSPLTVERDAVGLSAGLVYRF